ncbi:hypothetical protein C9374_004716 [Naegleria lovaniensis]|uniref:Gamma-secretase-activating protein C-terminal domain-containing protein n=1 Tax=Naegleria lovaniensis TaxID=51637 RepID=A0AA88GQM2_NAELO|nr:uncharacterized protein C9374_004716 [Naegleria lovaniensis]KAG2383379.1 hypothetical protein C9374_004716 [Naegleria lovaniensis]
MGGSTVLISFQQEKRFRSVFTDSAACNVYKTLFTNAVEIVSSDALATIAMATAVSIVNVKGKMGFPPFSLDPETLMGNVDLSGERKMFLFQTKHDFIVPDYNLDLCVSAAKTSAANQGFNPDLKVQHFMDTVQYPPGVTLSRFNCANHLVSIRNNDNKSSLSLTLDEPSVANHISSESHMNNDHSLLSDSNLGQTAANNNNYNNYLIDPTISMMDEDQQQHDFDTINQRILMQEPEEHNGSIITTDNGTESQVGVLSEGQQQQQLLPSSQQQSSMSSEVFSQTTKSNETQIPNENRNNILNSSGDLQQQLKSSKRKRISVYVVGQERANLFLVARDDLLSDKTCIELVEFPVSTKSQGNINIINSSSNLLNSSSITNNVGDRKIIYIHNTKMKCLYASISHQRNILAFTHFFVSNNQVHFQIFIVEINSTLSTSDLKSEESISKFQKQQNRYVFSPPQTSDMIFHCVQFIHPPQTADSNSSFDTKSCRFFLVTEKQSIRMFNISITESSSNFFINIFKKNQQSSINIEELVIFVKHFVWWQYDPVRSLLYYMLVREDMNNSRDSHEMLNNELRKTCCSLRCISISEKKPNQLFECLIPVNIHRSLLSDNLKMKSDIIRTPWRSGPSSHDLNSHFQIIRLENNGICLCQQQPKFSNNLPDNYIDAVIFILHHKKKMHFSVPVPSRYSRKHPRLFFGSCRDTVIVYLPGWYLQIIDCSKDHEPWPLMNFIGHDTVPHLTHPIAESRSKGKKIEQALSLYSLSNSTNYILDLSRGYLYNYDFNLDNMLNWIVRLKKHQFFTPQNFCDYDSVNIRKITIQFLHLAITHFRNNIFTDRIIRTLCEPFKTNCGLCEEFLTLVDDEVLFMEYLIGAGYMELQGMIHSSTTQGSTTSTSVPDKEFLRHIPISLLECGGESVFVDSCYCEQNPFVSTKIANVMGNTSFTRSYDNIVRVSSFPRDGASCALDLFKQVKSNISNDPKSIPLAAYLVHNKNHIIQGSASPSHPSGNVSPMKYLDEKHSTYAKKWYNFFHSRSDSAEDAFSSSFPEDEEEEEPQLTIPKKSPLSKKIDFYSEKSKTDFIDILSYFLLANNPRYQAVELQEYTSSGPTKATRMKTILDYTTTLFHLSQHLFTTVTEILHTFNQKRKLEMLQLHSSMNNEINLEKSNTLEQPYPMWYFNLLQKLHVSLEETNFPSPTGFQEHFATVGVHLLPLSTLSQYITRDLFVVTDQVLAEVVKKQSQQQKNSRNALHDNSKEWSYLMRTLIQKLHDKDFRDVYYYEKMLYALETDPSFSSVVSSEHFSEVINNTLLNYYHAVLVEHINNSVKASNVTNNKQRITVTPLDNLQFLEEFKRQREEHLDPSMYSTSLPLTYFLMAIKALNSSLLPKPTLLKTYYSAASPLDDSGSEEDSQNTSQNFYSLIQSVEYCSEENDNYVSFLKERSETILSLGGMKNLLK